MYLPTSLNLQSSDNVIIVYKRKLGIILLKQRLKSFCIAIFMVGCYLTFFFSTIVHFIIIKDLGMDRISGQQRILSFKSGRKTDIWPNIRLDNRYPAADLDIQQGQTLNFIPGRILNLKPGPIPWYPVQPLRTYSNNTVELNSWFAYAWAAFREAEGDVVVAA